jgi:hypothetical protein
MLDGLDNESLDSPVEENSSPQFSRSAFVAKPSGTPKSDHQVQKRALHETKAKLDCARKDLALKDQAAIAANDMLYDLRAKLSEVSSAAKKRQADAAAREASLEESLQLARQRLAEEKHRAAKSLEDQSRSRAALATEQAALASASAAKEAALERCLIDERKQRMRAEDREQAERAARAHAEAELAHAVERGRAEMKARLLEAQRGHEIAKSALEATKLELSSLSDKSLALARQVDDGTRALAEAARREAAAQSSLAAVQAQLSKERHEAGAFRDAQQAAIRKHAEAQEALAQACFQGEVAAAQAAARLEVSEAAARVAWSAAETAKARAAEACARREAMQTERDAASSAEAGLRSRMEELLAKMSFAEDLGRNLESSRSALNAAAAREQAAETARAAVDAELVEVRTALRLETSKLVEARTMLESTAAELEGRLGALETTATRGEMLAERLAEAEARLAENAAALHARHADVDEMGRELTDTNAKLVAAVQSAADAQRERSATQEKLDTALLEAAEARHAVATLVLREVSVVSGAAGRSNGRSGGSYPGGSVQEEADGQRLRAALVRQEAEREMAAALEREGKLKERVQAVLGETVLLKGERDLARAEAAEAKRRAAELEQLAAEERMHAAKAQYSLSTREAELQAAREQAENSAAARVVEAVATVRKELYERILGAEELSAKSVEQAATLERRAAEMQACLSRREADLEQGILTTVRAHAEVRAVEARAAAAEQRFANDRLAAHRSQLEWACEREREMRAAAAAELETARKETVGYERKLLRASSEMEAWRRKANDLEAQMNDLEAQMALAQAAAARAASEAVTSLKQAAIDTATAVADAEAARAEAARAEAARAEAAARAEDLAVTGAAAAPAAVLAAPAHNLDLLLAAARGDVRQDTRSIATAGTSATGAGAGLAWGAATSPCGTAVGTSPCGTPVGTSPCGTAVGAHVPRAVCASPERPERPSLGRFLAAAGQPLATLVMSSLSDEDVAGICKREGRTPRRMREREVLRTAPPRSPNPGPSPGKGVGERLVERTPGRTPRPRRTSPRAASGSGSPRS